MGQLKAWVGEKVRDNYVTEWLIGLQLRLNDVQSVKSFKLPLGFVRM